MSFKTLISKEEISKRIQELGEQITKDYGETRHKGDEIVIIGILRGSILFMADLIREVKTPLVIDFLEASSYGASTKSSGEVKLLRDLRSSIGGKDVLIVEDIVDTGITLTSLISHLQQKKPRSLKICSLLHKPSRQIKEVPISYLGFTIEDHFVIGFGLDFNERYRELPEVAIYSE